MNAILEQRILEKLHQLDEKYLYQVINFLNDIEHKTVSVRQGKGMLKNRQKNIPQDDFSKAILQDDQQSRS